MADYVDIRKWLAVALIAGIFILAFFILKPIIIPIIFGLLFAYVFSPVYKLIKRKIKGKNISALILLIGLALIVAVPIIYFVPIMIRQSSELYILLRNFDFGQILSNFMQNDIASSLSSNINNMIYKISSTFQNQLINLPSFLLQFVVFLFTFYFAVRDGNELRDYISTLSPFSDSTEKKFLKEFRGITNAIVFGQVLIGVVQGLAVGVGLFFLGIPNVLILTFITMIVSMIPVLGSWIIWLPVGLFLLLTGQTFNGIFLLLYGALFVSTIDNLIRPYLLSKQSNLPVALSIIGTIGGLYFFGIAGLVLGPLILAYILIIIEFYQKGKLKDLFGK